MTNAYVIQIAGRTVGTIMPINRFISSLPARLLQGSKDAPSRRRSTPNAPRGAFAGFHSQMVREKK